jgi:hypothetical protein
VSANENLEIALDNNYTNAAAIDTASTNTNINQNTTGNPYTWGNLVDLTTAFTSVSGKLQIKPVAYSSGALNYPKYGKDGRVASVDTALTASVISDKATGATAPTSVDGGVWGYSQQTSNPTSYDAFRVDYWLRSNETCNVSLSATGVKRAASSNDASATDTDVNGVTGGGSYIQVTLKKGTDNTVAKVEKYLKNLVIRFDTTDANNSAVSYYARMTAATDNATVVSTTADTTVLKYTLALDEKLNSDNAAASAKTISLTADTAKKVSMYVYLDGATVKCRCIVR